jgi:FAD/FMN-containing dehydrogenase
MSEHLLKLKGSFAGRLLTEREDVTPFVVDWRGMWHGNALAVAVPDTVDDVARIVGWCGAHDVPVVPQGGNTGLSGGSIPDQTGRSILVSLVRLNRIRAIDKYNNTMTVEAGCILQNIQDAALEVNRAVGEPSPAWVWDLPTYAF